MKETNTINVFRYREKISGLVERMKYQMARKEECKKSITEKVKNIKTMHFAMMELEPKLREMYTRMRCAETLVFNLEEELQRKENEIRLILCFPSTG